METGFDRLDKMFVRPKGTTKAYCTSLILTDLFGLARSAVMSQEVKKHIRKFVVFQCILQLLSYYLVEIISTNMPLIKHEL